MRAKPLIATLAVFLVSSPLGAQVRRPVRPGPAARPTRGTGNNSGGPQETLSVSEAATALRSNDPERVMAGVDSLTVLGTVDAVARIVALLQSGPVDVVTDYAVEKLGIIGDPSAVPELAELIRHRRPLVRIKALTALAQIRDPRVRSLLESGLHDSNGEVRGAAARALGELGARDSVPMLFRAFERGVPEAAESIGRLGDALSAVSPDPNWDREDPRSTSRRPTLAMWLGRMPLSVLLRGFERFLGRNDIHATAKVQIIIRLEQQASAQVREFLQRWVASLPPNYRGPDRARAELAIQQIRVPTGSGAP
jgi:HEAT repeat protein